MASVGLGIAQYTPAPVSVMPVSAIGVSARPYLMRQGVLGRVCAVFRRSCYMQTHDNDLLCIADEALGRGPLTVSVRLPYATDLQTLPLQAQRMYGEGHLLYIGSIALDLEDAPVWKSHLPEGKVDNHTLLRARKLTLALSEGVPPDGLGRLLPKIEKIAVGEYPDIHVPTPLATLACTAALNVVNGLAGHDPHAVTEGVSRLLGLGPGLTPSGDDLLAGMLLALHVGAPSDVGILSQIVLHHAAAKTTAISASMLNQASQGLGHEASHRLIASLVDGEPDDEVLSVSTSLTSVGHTSGWDTLLGILLGLHLAGRLLR